jgi:hypothetical protein
MHKKIKIASILFGLTGAFLAFLDAQRTSYGFSGGGVRLGLGSGYYTWFWRHCGEMAFLCLFIAFALEFVVIAFCKTDTIGNIHISGYKRLGIFCSGLWLLLAATIYFLGIALYPSFLTNSLSKLYTWVDDTSVKATDSWIPIIPTVNELRLSLFVLLPVVLCWTVLYVIPLSIRWIKEGFKNEPKRDA